MVSKKVVIHFPPKLVDQPIICKLVKDYDLEFNILKAYVTPEEEGLLILELSGQETSYKKGVDYLTKAGLRVQPLAKDIIRDEDRCTDCSVCVAICPTAALAVAAKTRKVDFYNDKCIACELCVRVCPYKAMKLKF